MTIRFNNDLLFWSLATLQPASIEDALLFISEIFPDVRPLPEAKELVPAVESWRDIGYFSQVHVKRRLFSLTSSGNEQLSFSLRRYRDRVRLFLLKSARDASLSLSEEARERLAGASPAVDGSSSTQEDTRPKGSAAVPRGPRTTGRTLWPRVVKQLNFKVGSESRLSDTFFHYYSFPTLDAIHAASERPAQGKDLSITDLGIALGISPRLLTSFTHKPIKHYRQFQIGKRGGGSRVISSPKAFLKVVQYWLLDYFLLRLPVHENCHSYQKGKSILSNASPHVAHAYVANFDIEDFFGSIKSEMVLDLLLRQGFGRQFAYAISKLVTLSNSLPQGAPTSPVISNAYLCSFDEAMTDFVNAKGLAYTRYADDVTVSGKNRREIIEAIKYAERLLKERSLRVNAKKTRIASRGGQQKVTGVMVNVKLQPSRKLRREIRAMFHQAELHPEIFKDRILEMQGYLSYLKSFPALAESRDLHEYRRIIKNLKS